MSKTQNTEIKAFLITMYSDQILGKGMALQDVGDDFDLLAEGIIDSLGIIEMISGVEKKFGLSVDLEAMPAEHLTVLGPFSDFVALSINNSSSSA